MPTDSEVLQAKLIAEQKAYIDKLAEDARLARERFDWEKARAVANDAIWKADRDRISANDEIRNADIRRIADSQVAAAAGIAYEERRREALHILDTLVEKRVAATSVVSVSGSASKTSAASLAADAVAIQKALDVALPPPVLG
jgi:hypothetical protein